MMQALAQHFAVLRNTFQRIFSARMAGIFNILVIGIALSLPAGLYVLLKNVQGMVAQLSSAPQISLFLSLEANEEDIARVRQQLRQHPAVARAEFVSRGQALEQLKRSTGLADVIGVLDKNPLPDAFIVYPQQSTAKALDSLRSELSQWPGVEQAQLDTAWAYKLEALLNFGRLAVLILAGLLSVALIAITFNTIRLQILTQRDEIEVSKLIGATNGFIRRPFLYFGALQGLLGGITAWLIVTGSLLLLNRELGALSQLYASRFVLQPLSQADSLSLLLFSLYLGWLGAWLSVARHLARIEPR